MAKMKVNNHSVLVSKSSFIDAMKVQPRSAATNTRMENAIENQ
jgi:hypothetical protein